MEIVYRPQEEQMCQEKKMETARTVMMTPCCTTVRRDKMLPIASWHHYQLIRNTNRGDWER